MALFHSIFCCCFTALSALFHSIFPLLFHSIFSLLFHSIFGAVSQYLLLLFQIIIGTVSSFLPGCVTVQLYSWAFSSFIPGCVTVQLYSSRFQLYSQPCYCTALFLAMLLFRSRNFSLLQALLNLLKGIDRPFRGWVKSSLIRSLFINWRLGNFFLLFFSSR